jgi:hypothetical protein
MTYPVYQFLSLRHRCCANTLGLEEHDQDVSSIQRNSTVDRPSLAHTGHHPGPGHTTSLQPSLLSLLDTTHQYSELPTSLQLRARPDHAVSFPDAAPGRCTSRLLPPVSDRNSYGMTDGTEYAPSMQDMLERQVQVVQGMGLAPQYSSEYSTCSSSHAGLKSGQNSWQDSPLQISNGLGSQPSLADRSQNHEDREGDRINGASQFMSGLGTPNSQILPLQPLMAGTQLTVPAARVTSRQPSRQSSVERSHLSINSEISGQGGMHDNDANCDQLMVKPALPRELKHNVFGCYYPSDIY